MDILIKAAQLILSLSILIVLHELGHFIPARLFKTRVEKFYLFFNPWFSLFKKKIGETEWGIGWLPFGGYVKIAGMVDESMDKEQLAKPAQPWEFRSKPAWQRLIIMIGGVTVNLLLGIFIYICVMFYYGEEQLKPTELKAGMSINPYFGKYGIYSGDNILRVNGEEIMNINDVNNRIMLRDGRKLEVLNQSTLVDTVMPGTPALKAGLKKGDNIVAINGKKIAYYDEIQRYLYAARGKKATVEILRNGRSVLLHPKVKKEGTIGFAVKTTNIIDESSIKTVHYGFGKSISRGIDNGFHTLTDYVAQMKFLFTKKGASSIGGFAAIGSMFSPEWDWEIFWLRTAFISIVLAFMNILPIPALDGGHVVFLLYEMITGREAPQKVLEYAQYIGFFLLMGLLLYANGNDLVRWLLDR